MKESKPWLLIGSFVLLFISLVLMGVWIYFYSNNKSNDPVHSLTKPDKAPIITYRDSLQRNYNAAVTQLDTSRLLKKSSTDSSNTITAQQLKELYKLRDEIPTLLANQPTAKELDSASLKIAQLQGKVNELQSRSERIEAENKQLLQALAQLRSQYQKVNITRNRTTSTSTIATPVPEKTSELQCIVSDVRLWAMDANEKQTNTSEQATKIAGSFAVRKNGAASAFEIFVVILHPNGRVLKSDNWESGVFESLNGRKAYSQKLLFDDAGGNLKRFSFSIDATDLLKGTYLVQIYQNGIMAASGRATLL